ncbi:MAG TPA: hypothetical protein PLS11_14210 [Ottowia sp.]|nr:hypothetical protein [Ottowia sp.]
MSASIPSPDGVVENDRHHHHDHHTVEVDAEAAPAPTPDTDPVGVIEAALVRLVDDVGVLAEEDVVRAFAILKATDLPSYLRLRHAAKKTNRDCSVTVLDKLVRDELPGSDDDASALDELVTLARAQCQLHHDADRNAVAVIPMPSRREVWRVYSSGFEDWLRAAYWRAKEMGVPETTMKSALATLAAAGINDGDEIEVHVRAARCDDGYLIDLADEQWQAIHVTPQGWRVVNESPVYFTRTPSMRSLPMPVPTRMTHGDVGLLWQHTNVPTHSRVMVLAWLLDCFRPDTPFPALELVGEQGSAKSTTQFVLRSLVDPNKVMLRGRPKTVEDVFVAAANNWLVSYENLSGLTPEQQDAFCTLATGCGFASRQLYTNGEEHVMETKRPVVLNGIAVVATRPDLIDRVIHVDLPTIPADARRDDADTYAGWERDQSKVFAGLLDLFSAALAILPTVKLTQKQRMADYERLGEAVARAMGFAAGEFQQQYAELVRAGIDRALESNAVAQALDRYIAERVLPLNWQGTAGQLYDLLNTHSIPDRSSWPRSPKGLSDQLRRIAPAYRAKGIDITHLGHSREGARWRIAQTRSQTNPATPPGIEGGTRYGAHRE